MFIFCSLAESSPQRLSLGNEPEINSGRVQGGMCTFRVEVGTSFLESLGSGLHLGSQGVLLPKYDRRKGCCSLIF